MSLPCSFNLFLVSIDLIFAIKKMGSSKTFILREAGETSKKWKYQIEKSSKDEMGGEISRLPKDIVLEIFSQLSIKDLKQCLWVRKSWYQTIHSPYFIKLHHELSDFRSNRTVSLMVQDLNADDPRSPHDLYLVEYELSGDSVTSCGVIPLRTKFKEMNAEFEVVGSSNGLICFSESSLSDPIYICNPVLGEYMTLPLTIEHPDIDIISGFGFDATGGKFKVIRMVYLSAAEHTDDVLWYELEAEIYTVGSKNWRNIGFVRYPPRGDKPGVLLNGVLHWMCDRQLCPEEPYGIVSFDLASEEFGILPPPPGYGSGEIDIETEDGQHFEIRVLKGQLCYFDRRDNQVVAWVMKQYGLKESWTQGISLHDLFSDFHVLNFTEGLPTRYEAFIHVPSLVSNIDGKDEPVGRPKGYANLEKWSKNLYGIATPVCSHFMLPPNCPQKDKMYSHAYARVQSSKESGVEHLIRYDQLYEYHEAVAFENHELSNVGSTSNADPTFDIPETDIESLMRASPEDEEAADGQPGKHITLDEFCKIIGID